jgi:hypothetical protein
MTLRASRVRPRLHGRRFCRRRFVRRPGRHRSRVERSVDDRRLSRDSDEAGALTGIADVGELRPVTVASIVLPGDFQRRKHTTSAPIIACGPIASEFPSAPERTVAAPIRRASPAPFFGFAYLASSLANTLTGTHFPWGRALNQERAARALGIRSTMKCARTVSRRESERSGSRPALFSTPCVVTADPSFRIVA